MPDQLPGAGLQGEVEGIPGEKPGWHLRQQQQPSPVKWTVDFGARSVFTIRFDGQQWSVEPIDVPDADVRLETTPQTWATFLLSSPEKERRRLLEGMHIRGEQAGVDELLAINWIEKQP